MKSKKKKKNQTNNLKHIIKFNESILNLSSTLTYLLTYTIRCVINIFKFISYNIKRIYIYII